MKKTNFRQPQKIESRFKRTDCKIE